jgi:hypothetical protein
MLPIFLAATASAASFSFDGYTDADELGLDLSAYSSMVEAVQLQNYAAPDDSIETVALVVLRQNTTTSALALGEDSCPEGGTSRWLHEQKVALKFQSASWGSLVVSAR